jgi:hypothetical protein
MVNRALSEAFLKNNSVPEGREVISRRIHLQLLRSRTLLDRLSIRDRDAILMADGHWDWDLINEVTASAEPLRLLRWLIGVDAYLPDIGQQLDLDFQIASELIHNPDKVRKGRLQDLADVRVGMNTAHTFLVRCVAEAIQRGLIPSGAEASDWASTTFSEIRGDQSMDLILDHTVVSEAEDPRLLTAIELSRRRFKFLSWVESLLESGSVPDSPLTCFEQNENDVETVKVSALPPAPLPPSTPE